MALTDDDKERIEEEEKFRAAARAKAEADAKKAEADAKSKKTATGCLGCLGVLFVFFLIGTFTSNQKSSSVPPRNSSATTSQTAAKTSSQDAANCQQDLGCLGEKHLVSASVRCKRQVEALAKYSAEWTDGFLEPKFSHYRWKNKSAGIVTYIGDKVKFQNGFGAWQNMVYECDFDTNSERPVGARAEPGRLP